MKHAVKIIDKHQKRAGSNARTLAFGLVEILAVIGDFGQALTWRIGEIEGTGDLASLGSSLGELEERVNSSPLGHEVSWIELFNIGRYMVQIVDGVFYGFVIGYQPSPSATSLELYNDCEIYIEAFDSSWWEVLSDRDEVIARIQAAFLETELIPAD